jgi:hypothetical protein
MLLTTLFGKASNMDFYTSGNFFVPIHDTDISLKKAILTIDLADGEFVETNVYYELYNLDVSKNISIKFEAKKSDKMPLDITQGIKDFKLTVNGDIQDIKSSVDTCYTYYANVQLIKGKNILRNTFKYRVKKNGDFDFYAPFNLCTLNCWANRQADDFTLRIIGGSNYYIADEAFRGTPYSHEKYKYNFWRFKAIDEKYYALYSSGRSDTLVWHKTNFSPNDDMAILSSISSVNDTFGWVVENSKGECVGRYDGDCGDSYLIDVQDWGTVPKEGHKVVKYRAEDGKGCVYISNKVKYTTKNGEKMQIVNVRALPSMKSSIIGTIDELYGDLPTAVDCLGYVPSVDDNSRDKWYKVDIDGKVGYVRADLMYWNSMNTF